MLEEAMDKHRTGDFAGAESLYRKMLDQEPDNIEILHLLAITRMEQGELDDARTTVKKAIGLQANAAAFYATLASIEHRSGMLEDALGSMSRALELNPNLPQAHNTLGYLQYLSGDLDSAEKNLSTAIRLEPESIQAMTNLGNVRLAKGNVDRAITHFQDALDRSPNELAPLASLGEAFLYKGTPAFAEECFNKCLAQRPESVKLKTLLAQSVLAGGRTSEAREMFNAILSDQPEHFEAQVGLGDADVVDGDFAGASRHFQQALTIQRGHPLVIEKLADSLLALSDATTAIQCYQALIDDNSPVGRIHAKLGRALLEVGSTNEAEDYLEAVHAANPADTQTVLSLAQLREMQGREDDAIALLESSLEVISNPDAALYALASLSMAMGQSDASIDYLNRIEQSHDDTSRIHINGMKARAYDAAGDYDAAAQSIAEMATYPIAEIRIPASASADLLKEWPTQTPDDDRGDPVFLVGLPGSGVSELASSMDEQASIEVIDDRFFAQADRNDILQHSPGHDELGSMTDDDVHSARRQYWNSWQRQREKVADRVIGLDYLPVEQFDVATIARVFPQATLLVVNREAEDLLLHGKLCGWQQGYVLSEAATAGFNSQLELARSRAGLNVVEINCIDDLQNALNSLDALLGEHQITYDDLSVDMQTRLAGTGNLMAYYPTGHHSHYPALMNPADGDATSIH